MRAFVDARRQPFALRPFDAGGEHEAAVAVEAFDEVGLAHLQPDARMAERAADAVAGDAAERTVITSGGGKVVCGAGAGAALAAAFGLRAIERDSNASAALARRRFAA